MELLTLTESSDSSGAHAAISSVVKASPEIAQNPLIVSSSLSSPATFRAFD
jgi:hypothetical protein